MIRRQGPSVQTLGADQDSAGGDGDDGAGGGGGSEDQGFVGGIHDAQAAASIEDIGQGQMAAGQQRRRRF